MTGRNTINVYGQKVDIDISRRDGKCSGSAVFEGKSYSSEGRSERAVISAIRNKIVRNND